MTRALDPGALEAISVLVVEDEPRQRSRLARLLEAMPEFTVAGACANGREAVDAIRTLAPDLVLLDVQMPEMNGIEVLEAVGPEHLPAVIFVTAYDRYALRAFELHALDYLLKPFDDDRLEQALARARDRIRHGQLQALSQQLMALVRHLQRDTGTPAARAPGEPPYLERLAIRTSGRLMIVKATQIDWIEGAGVYVQLHLGNKKYALRESLGALEERLDPARFVRIHRSTIVNVDRIKELVSHFHGEYIVILENGTELKLTRSYRDKLDVIAGKMG